MPSKRGTGKGLRSLLLGKGRVSARLRSINIMLFITAFLLIALAMYMAFSNIIDRVSIDYAERYAASSSEALSAHIAKEIGLLARAARSEAVVDWFKDEGNKDKMHFAYKEMSAIVEELYSVNMYVGVELSKNEYRVEEEYTRDSISEVATLDPNNPDNVWYFNCLNSENEYILDVDIDHLLNRKRVWIDYKVTDGADTLGVIATGLEFSHVANELFSQYSGSGIRGLIIDDEGIIHIDSEQLGDEIYLFNGYETRAKDIFADRVLLEVINTYLSGEDGYFEGLSEPVGAVIPSGAYRYASIAHVKHTGWSVIILHDSSSVLGMNLFVPVVILVLILLITFAALINSLSNSIVFKPLDRLVDSLERFKENPEGNIYGIDREDEFGELSNTILDLFTKANYDALTGIYNRRFMENNLQHTMELLSRSNGVLSVMMADIDYFKKYNDTLGHDQGDVCLKSIAGIIAGSAERANDFAVRYGGEEFLLVLPNADEQGARAIAQKLLENIRALNMPHPDSEAAEYVTVSVGVTTGSVLYDRGWEEYVKRADEALYISKQSGRDRYTWVDFETGREDMN